MLSTPNGLASLLSKFHRQLLCMKHYERAFQPDFCSAMPPNCHPFSCLLMQNHLFCRPVWPVTTPNNTMHPSAILRFFRQESISSLIIFACSAYCYTSPAPLILCSTLFISKFTFLQKTLFLQSFLLPVKLNEYSFLNLLSFHLSGKSWFQFFQAFWCSDFFLPRYVLQILLCFTSLYFSGSMISALTQNASSYENTTMLI